jgi:hypothetical protein
MVPEVAEIFRCSAHQIYKMIDNEQIKPIMALGKPYRFDPEYIQQLITVPLEPARAQSSLKTKYARRAKTGKISRSLFSQPKGKQKLWE